MDKHARSIKADEVMARARKAAAQVVEREMGRIDGDAVRLGWHPGFGTVGLFIDRDRLRDLQVDRAFEMASSIAGEMGGVVGKLGPAAIFVQDHLVIGFCPDDIIQFEGFRWGQGGRRGYPAPPHNPAWRGPRCWAWSRRAG